MKGTRGSSEKELAVNAMGAHGSPIGYPYQENNWIMRSCVSYKKRSRRNVRDVHGSLVGDPHQEYIE